MHTYIVLCHKESLVQASLCFQTYLNNNYMGNAVHCGASVRAKWQSVSQSGDRESGVGGSVASHNSFMSNSDSSAGGTSDMKYQKCKFYIVITVINRTQTNV